MTSDIDCCKYLSKCKAQCCGPVTFRKDFWEKYQDKAIREIIEIITEKHFIIAITEDFRCCFLTQDYKCSIYNDRPDICRKIGNEKYKFLTCSWKNRNGN